MSYANLPPRREGLRWCEAHRRTARRLMSPDEPTSDDPKNCKRASPLQANLTGLSEASDALGVLARWPAGAQAARIMAVIAASRVLRDVTLGPFQVWVWVLVQSVWPGSEHKCNVWLWEAVRSPVRRSHFTAVVCPTGRVGRLCERTAILVILTALMMSAQWIVIVWACPGLACPVKLTRK